jgi:hypothetical protein
MELMSFKILKFSQVFLHFPKKLGTAFCPFNGLCLPISKSHFFFSFTKFIPSNPNFWSHNFFF